MSGMQNPTKRLSEIITGVDRTTLFALVGNQTPTRVAQESERQFLERMCIDRRERIQRNADRKAGNLEGEQENFSDDLVHLEFTQAVFYLAFCRQLARARVRADIQRSFAAVRGAATRDVVDHDHRSYVSLHS